ncbi:MAG: D-glycerate dehydrogenase [Phycisphaerales bacterium]|nr:D-glycerate dehydrogenase [Phycisphaerales bacterium]MCB9864195.1 D-glycerate dehydrogenase [Phycisphaerales bacterium]
MSDKTVLVTRLIPEIGVRLLQKAGLRVRMNQQARQYREDELAEAVRDVDAVVCQLADRFRAQVLESAAPRCKVIATCAVGYDNIDVAAAAKLGIHVTNTPDVLTNATADLTWALLLATARRLGEAERFVRAGAWRGWGMLQYLGADVYGRTLGIIGAGRIGTAVARRAAGFDMPILYHARHDNAAMNDLGAKRVGLPVLLAQSDFISLHVPLTPETRRMLDAEAFGRIKKGAILINTARGAVLDQAELINALRTGRLAAAGLDVYDGEPSIPKELLELDNVVALPHIGSATVTTRNRMAEMAAQNVIAVLKGEPPLNPVLPPSAD